MSSTTQSAKRNHHDHYTTPMDTVFEFITKFQELEPFFDFGSARILDPAAGGTVSTPMPYPLAFSLLGAIDIVTVDIRPDSPAGIHADYMQWYPDVDFDLVITNPPYRLALDYIITALEDCTDNGHVVMLLRLNFLGSQQRREFWQTNPPKYVIVHSKRPRFTGKSDSTEYAHFVWQKGYSGNTSMFVV